MKRIQSKIKIKPFYNANVIAEEESGHGRDLVPRHLTGVSRTKGFAFGPAFVMEIYS